MRQVHGGVEVAYMSGDMLLIALARQAKRRVKNEIVGRWTFALSEAEKFLPWLAESLKAVKELPPVRIPKYAVEGVKVGEPLTFSFRTKTYFHAAQVQETQEQF